MKIESCSELIGFKRFKNYHFAIKQHYYCHIFRSEKAADCQNIAGALNSYEFVPLPVKGLSSKFF